MWNAIAILAENMWNRSITLGWKPKDNIKSTAEKIFEWYKKI